MKTEDRNEMIQGMQQHVLRIWKKSRPKLMASMTPAERGQATLAAAESWLEMLTQLKAEGMSHLEAQNTALREFVVLPDLGEEETTDSEPTSESEEPSRSLLKRGTKKTSPPSNS